MNQIAGYIQENYTGYTASARTIAAVAARYIEAAGQAGGIQEVEAIARDGWCSDLTSDARIGEDCTSVKQLIDESFDVLY